MNILTLNAGSSSIKYKVFIGDSKKVLISGLISGIGEAKGSWEHNKQVSAEAFSDHKTAFEALAQRLQPELVKHPLNGIGHRVVHGGDIFYKPTLITAEVLKTIQDLAKLAPIHNPVNALGIELALEHFPKIRQVAVFDTGFHHSMPEKTHLYPINKAIADRYQIRRYGFHGINHEYVAIQAAHYLDKPLAESNFISLHLGNGASACLIKEGKSVDTSMGLTPLAGLMMGTRCGDIDPAIPLYLLAQGLEAQEVDRILNKESGLLGLAQENDMRKVLSLAEAGDEKARLALDIYVYSIQKTIGAYLSQLPSLDALIFTAGVGENAALIRQRVIEPLGHLGFFVDPEMNNQRPGLGCWSISNKGYPILVIAGDEEVMIAEAVSTLPS